MFVGYAATAVPFAFAIAALWGRRYDEWVKASLPWALLTVVTLGLRDPARRLLGLRDARLGRLLGLGPGRELLAGAVARVGGAGPRHAPAARPRPLPPAQLRARHPGLRPGRLRHLPDPLRRARRLLGALLRRPRHHRLAGRQPRGLPRDRVRRPARGAGARSRRRPGDEPFLSRTVFFVLAHRDAAGHRRDGPARHLGAADHPLASEPSQVGPAFYNRVTLPVGILFATLLGVVPLPPLARRRRTCSASGCCRHRWAWPRSLTAARRGSRRPGRPLHGLPLRLAVRVRLQSVKTVEEVRKGRLRVAGGYLAHVGLGLMLAGIITSSAFDRTEKVVLPLGESKQVLGYTLTFRGVDKPTPTARDAMLVEVKDERGRTYIARPKMFRNEKSNQLVANPDVRMRLTHDLYIAPIEFDPGRQAETGDDDRARQGRDRHGRPVSITFTGFDMSGAHGGGRDDERRPPSSASLPAVRRSSSGRRCPRARRGSSRSAGRAARKQRRHRLGRRAQRQRGPRAAGGQGRFVGCRQTRQRAAGRDADLPRRHADLRRVRPLGLRPAGGQDQPRRRPQGRRRAGASRGRRDHGVLPQRRDLGEARRRRRAGARRRDDPRRAHEPEREERRAPRARRERADRTRGSRPGSPRTSPSSR